MRDENYFEKKLVISKDTLKMAKRQLEHLDVQINVLKVRFDYDKKVYDDQAVHMQDTVTEMEKRIPALQKKLDAGYTHVDLKTGKAYKSFEAIHEGRLKDKIKESKLQQARFEELQKQKVALKIKKKNIKKMTKAELQIVQAEEIREAMQPKDEIEENIVKQRESIEAKTAYYEEELARLKAENATLKTKPKIDLDEITEDTDFVKIKIPLPEEEEKAEVLEIVEDPHLGKVECPECGKWYTKGGGFASHYKTHYNGE